MTDTTVVDAAVQHALTEARAGRLCTDADMWQRFGLTPNIAELCRIMAEDQLIAERPAPNPAKKEAKGGFGRCYGTSHENYQKSKAEESIAGFARSLPRTKEQR